MRSTTRLGRGLIVALATLLLCGCFSNAPFPGQPPAPPPYNPPPYEPPPDPVDPPVDPGPVEGPEVFDKIEVGMTKAEVVEILGVPNTVPQDNGASVTLRWTVEDETGKYMFVGIFRDDVLTAKQVFESAGGDDAGG